MNNKLSCFLFAAALLVCATFAHSQVSVGMAPPIHFQFLNSSGLPLANGKIYTYQAGTTNCQNTYVDATGTTQNPCPIPLDSTGSPSNGSTQTGIFLSNTSWKFVAYDVNNVFQWSVDNVTTYFALLNSANTWTATQTFSNAVINTATVASLNKVCVVDGVTNLTLAAALACTGGIGTVEIAMVPVPALTANVTIPAAVTLKFDGSNSITTSSFTLTINGPLVAPNATQIFSGTGVRGLTTIQPEWFGSTAINTTIQSAFASTGGTLVLQPNTNYQSAFMSSGWTLSNVWIQGGGMPVSNAANTALVNGTVIQNGMQFLGASGIKITNVGFDVGSLLGVSTNDALSLCGATCSTPAEALITGIYIENVSAMLSSNAVAFHCIRVEHGIGAIVRNVETYFGTHGVAMKASNSTLIGVRAHGQSSEGVIVKADNYTGTSNVIVSHIYADTLSSANQLHDGVIVDAEQAALLSNVTISDVQVLNAQAGLALVSNGTAGSGAINGVNVNDFFYEVGNSGLGLANMNCVLSSGAGTQIFTWIHLSHFTCINGTAGSFFPIVLNLLLTNSTIENVQTAGSNSTGSTLQGNGLFVNNFTETNATDTRPFFVTGNATVFLSNYQGSALLNTSVISGGSTLTYTSYNTSTGPFLVTNGNATPFIVTNQAGTVNFFQVDSSGNAIPNNHLNQTGANHYAGTCTMAAASTCTFTLSNAYNSTPVCVAGLNGAGAPLAASCSVSGTTVTITATGNNSNAWGAILIGNAN